MTLELGWNSGSAWLTEVFGVEIEVETLADTGEGEVEGNAAALPDYSMHSGGGRRLLDEMGWP